MKSSATTKYKWRIDKVQDKFLKADEKFSEEFALNWDPSTKFSLYFNSCVALVGESAPLGLVLKSFEGRESVKTTLKFWIESTNGHKLVEHLFPEFEFKEEDDRCGFSLEQGREFGFFNKVYSENGCLYLCCDLRYKVSGNNLNIPSALDRTINTDATVNVGDREFKVCKNALSEASPVFKEMLSADTEGTITIDDVSVETMEALITFIHFGTLANLTDLAEEFFIAAEKYNIADLKSKCIDALGNKLSADNIFSRLVLAFIYEDASRLKNKCLKFVTQRPHSDFFTPLFNSADWVNLYQSNKELADQIMNAIFGKI